MRSILRKAEAVNTVPQSAQSTLRTALALLPEITPFPAAQVRLARPRPMTIQEPPCSPKIIDAQGLLGQVHVRNVSIAAQFVRAQLRPTPLPRHTREAEQEAHRGRGAQPRHDGFAPAPAPNLFQPADRSRQNGFVVEEMTEIVCQRLRSRVPFPRLLFQTLQANGGEIPRHTRVQQLRRHWFLVLNLLKCFS